MINLPNSRPRSGDWDNRIGKKNKLWSSNFNQLNVEGWNW
jgi:hypothetical protein